MTSWSVWWKYNVCSLKYGKYNFDNFNVVFYSLTTFVPNGQFVYFHFKSLITKFVFFCKYAQILYCLRTSRCFKSYILFVRPDTHCCYARVPRKFKFSIHDSPDVKTLKITDLGPFLTSSSSRLRCRDPCT